MRRAGALLVLSLASACTVVNTTPPRPRPRVEVGPPPPSGRSLADRADEATRPLREFDEVRALWVVRFSMVDEARVRRMVEDADAAGFNTLIVQVRGRGDAFHVSELEPRGEAMRDGPDFDPLQTTIEEAHRRGMAVHAWVNTHLVWGPAARPLSDDHIVNANPEWLAVPRGIGKELAGIAPADPAYVARLSRYARARPETVEGLYTSPSHPAVQDRVHEVWMDLVDRYDLDGIHFDYIRFPSSRFDYSVGALERFRSWVRSRVPIARFDELDRAYTADPYAFVEGEAVLWGDFRRAHVTRLVERIYGDVKSRRPRMVVSAAVVADADLAYADRFQDWRAWLRDGILDVAVPMAYTPDAARFERLVETARASVPDRRRVWAGIGAYMTTADGTMEMIDVARAEGAGGVVLFSYDWAVGDGRGDPANPFLQRVGQGRFGR